MERRIAGEKGRIFSIQTYGLHFLSFSLVLSCIFPSNQPIPHFSNAKVDFTSVQDSDLTITAKRSY